jgi:endonuclease G
MLQILSKPYVIGPVSFIIGAAGGVVITDSSWREWNREQNGGLMLPYWAQIIKIPKHSMIRVSPDQSFIVEYDYKTKNPRWVLEYLTKDSVFPPISTKSDDNENESKSSFSFKREKALPAKFSAKLDDFHKSGYDRGHIAAARNHKYQEKDLEFSYSLINVSPQVGNGFNRHYWNRIEQSKLAQLFVVFKSCSFQ